MNVVGRIRDNRFVALPRTDDPVTVRPRTPGDLARCVDVLRVVHRADGYPTVWPGDPEAWLTPRELYGCWVAEADALIGHFSLTPVDGTGEPALLEATGRSTAGLGRVGRLFVHPAGRGRGTARALLDTVVREAGVRGLHPVLDVVTDAHGAIRLYENAGWRRVHTGEAPWTNAVGERPSVHFYVAP